MEHVFRKVESHHPNTLMKMDSTTALVFSTIFFEIRKSNSADFKSKFTTSVDDHSLPEKKLLFDVS